jgi:ribosomal protein S11
MYKKNKKHINRPLFQFSLGQLGLSVKQRDNAFAMKKMCLISAEFALRYGIKKHSASIRIETRDLPYNVLPLLTHLYVNNTKILWITQSYTIPFNGCRLQKRRKG